MRGDAVHGVFAFDFGQLVIQIFAHLWRDAVRIERRVICGQARGTGLRAVQRFALHAVHSAGVAPKQNADLIIRAIALVDAHLLPAPFRKIDQLGGDREAGSLLEQRAQPPAQRATRNIRAAKRILNHGIVRTADLERSFAGADVQPGFAVKLSFEEQLSNQS